MDREIRRDPERYVGYRITDSWDEIVETLQGAPVSTDTELGAHVREFKSMVRRDMDEIYTMLDDEQSQRQLLADRVNMLFRDRRAHAHTRHLIETEARMSREAWGRSKDASDLAHAEVMSLRTIVHAQMSEIRELQSADRSRQRAISDLLETDRGRRKEIRELRQLITVTALQDSRDLWGSLHSHSCIEQDFMKCKPLYFKGTEGVVELTQWFERMETVFRISNCSVENQINFRTSFTLLPGGHNMDGFAADPTKFKRYVGRLPDMIHGNIVASKPKTMQEALKWPLNLMDKRVSTIAERQAENKRSLKTLPKLSESQPQNRGKTTGRAYTDGFGVREMPTNTNNKKGTKSGSETYSFLRCGVSDTSEGMSQGLKTTNQPMKIIPIPWGNETLIIHGDKSNQGHKTRLHIISYSKTQEYRLKGCPVFLAHVTTNEVQDKSEKKRLEYVSIVGDFPEVFPEDLPGVPPTRQVEFQIDLVPGAAPVARAP
ncbi:hypothetical protein Tco_0524221 [Tanacetum coccineum]